MQGKMRRRPGPAPVMSRETSRRPPKEAQSTRLDQMAHEIAELKKLVAMQAKLIERLLKKTGESQ